MKEISLISLKVKLIRLLLFVLACNSINILWVISEFTYVRNRFISIVATYLNMILLFINPLCWLVIPILLIKCFIDCKKGLFVSEKSTAYKLIIFAFWNLLVLNVPTYFSVLAFIGISGV